MSSFNPALILALCVLCPYLFIANRRNFIAAFIFGTIFLPMTQSIVLSGLDFSSTRILVYVSLIRIIVRGEHKHFSFTAIDKLIILWALTGTLSYTILRGNFDAFVNRLGYFSTALGLYFIFRFILVSRDEYLYTLRVFCYVSIILALFMAFEQITKKNFFHLLGAPHEVVVTRGYKLRSQGPFGHPILAGTFGAALFPLLFAVYYTKKQGRKLIFIGILASVVIVLTSSSSGPLLSLMTAIFSLLLWKSRAHTRFFKWIAFFILVGLSLVMEAPIWALMNRVGVVSGSTSYHRYALFDNFINRFDEWWLFGTESTAHWGYYLFDVTNNYVRIAIDGGLVSLIIWLLILFNSFKILGNLISEYNYQRKTMIFWSIGCSLFVHMISFFGVSYWDQILVIWYFLIATIAFTGLPTKPFHFENLKT